MTGGSFFARQMLTKKKLVLARRACILVCHKLGHLQNPKGKACFLATICCAKVTPRSRKSGYGLFCWSVLRIIYSIYEKKRGANHGKEQHAGKQSLAPPKQGGYLLNHLDRMRSSRSALHRSGIRLKKLRCWNKNRLKPGIYSPAVRIRYLNRSDVVELVG